MIVGPPVADSITHALDAIGRRNFGNTQGILDTFGAIDQALGETYVWALIHKVGGPIEIVPPTTYDKTLSVLPGDSDLPTDPEPPPDASLPRDVARELIFPRSTVREDNAAASFLPGDSEFPAEPEPDSEPTSKRRPDDFFR
jgi:hypothetical protein